MNWSKALDLAAGAVAAAEGTPVAFGAAVGAGAVAADDCPLVALGAGVAAGAAAGPQAARSANAPMIATVIIPTAVFDLSMI
ncbi:MAG: hypothetical protein Q8P59_10580, partial [Dehalococcoidia bacterium]|nr:hypothetical protein [Dehalococcoidia bacterium]